jgi:uncharacterized lipoprotein YajG
MLQAIKRYLFPLVMLVSIVSFSGCAGRNYLIVDYQVPASSHELDGQIVRLKVEDARQSGSILSSDAAYQFPEFSGIYSLAWILPSQERVLAGEHQLIELFKTVFEKRLAELGVSTVYTDDASVALLTITLKQFKLDLQNHKWMADLSYDAVLTQPDHPIAKENIHGSAERARIIGRKGADTVLSDIFSDVVNRLDFPKLFRNAKLIP